MPRSMHPFLRALTALVAVLLAASGSLAAAQGTGSYTAGDSTVTVPDTWTYEPDYSTPSSAYFSHAKLKMTVFGYIETPPIGSGDVDAMLDVFAMSSTDSFDPGTTHVVLKGVTGGDTAWRLYLTSAAGIPTAFVITANLSAQPGMSQLTLLMAPAGSFDLAFADARDGVQIDGQPVAFAALDPTLLVAAIEGDANETTVATNSAPTTPGPASQPVVVNGVDYGQLDAPTGCDRIGWAITDPSQLPVTEADVDQRGACAGGASYVAKCGTVPGERADQRYIACEVTALVTSGPQEFAFDMFELFDADGDSEYIDLGMSFGNDELFDSGPVPAGATVSGTAPFAIDATLTGPLLLEIRPPSLPPGTEPAVIVIDGQLQELTVFDQQGG